MPRETKTTKSGKPAPASKIKTAKSQASVKRTAGSKGATGVGAKKAAAKKRAEKKSPEKRPARVSIVKLAIPSGKDSGEPVAAKRARRVSPAKNTAARKTGKVVRAQEPSDREWAAGKSEKKMSKKISNKSKLMQEENQTENAENAAELPAEGADGKIFVRWTGKSFVQSAKDRRFYKISLFASILAVIWFAIGGNWLPVVTFLTTAVVMLFELRDEPRDIEYEINIDGILIDGKLYRFDGIDSFDVVEKAGYDIVRLKFRNSFFPVREIQLPGDQDPLYIETLLEYFLPNESQQDVLFNFDRRSDPRDDADRRTRRS